MPLEILLALVICGISAIAALLHLTGRSRRRVMDADEARHQWLRHFPQDRIAELTLSEDGHAALVRSDAGPGLLWALGDDTVGRRLNGCTFRAARGGMTVITGDFAAPRIRLTLGPEESRRWQEMLDCR